MMRKMSSLLVLPLIFLAVSCATTGPGGKKSFIIISTAQEVSIGKEMDAEVRRTDTLLDDVQWQTYINELGQRIVAVSDRRDLQFQFAVIKSDQINAFAAPGGYVYFYSGLIREMDGESELAAVMAHEISHVVARHSVKQLQSVMGISVLMQLALGESSETTRALAGTAVGIAMGGYSRSMEIEADQYGTVYMKSAGWNPQGMVAMFRKLEEISGHHEMGLFEMLASTHPQTGDRIDATNKQIAGMTGLASLVSDTPRFQQMKKRLPPPKKP